jgi:hypothetical protein
MYARLPGALMWSLGKVVQTPEVLRVFIGSFWDQPLKDGDFKGLFEAEAQDLIAGLLQFDCYAVVLVVLPFKSTCCWPCRPAVAAAQLHRPQSGLLLQAAIEPNTVRFGCRSTS